MQEQASGTVTFNLPKAFSEPPLPRLLAIKDCAKILKCTYRHAYDLLVQKDGPPLKYLSSRCVRISYDDFVQWLDSRPNSNAKG